MNLHMARILVLPRVLSRSFCLGGKSILKNIFEPSGGAKKFFLGLLGGSGGMLPQKILKI